MMVMGRKFITLGVILLLAGAGTLGWGFVEQRKEKQMLKDIKLRLEKLDKVSADETDIRYLADIFSRDDWQQKLDEYNTQRQSRGFLIDTSVVLMLTGGAVFAWWFLWLAIRSVNRRLFLSRAKGRINDDAVDSGTETKEKPRRLVQPSNQTIEPNKDETGKQVDVLVSSGWFDFNKGCADHSNKDSVRSETYFNNKPSGDSTDGISKNANLLFCDEKASASKKSLKLKVDRLNKRYRSLTRREVFSDSSEDTAKLQKVLKAQGKSLEKQIAEFRQVVETLKQAAIDRSQPYSDTIKELVQQVSAIREYALSQQDRINKLQDGYDWGIIKSFGLKVIRCIDNLENRMEWLTKDGIETTGLEEVSDELIFALESSGIEQYEPEVDSDYSGQEKVAEAVKEKAHAQGPELKGKVAEVIRPGYRHFIDDKNFKVVRTARVKLFA